MGRKIKCRKCGHKIDIEDFNISRMNPGCNVKCTNIDCLAVNHVKCRHKSGCIKSIVIVNGK
ncbi:MAG: hypothetical protein ABIC36_01890 [bacterium]